MEASPWSKGVAQPAGESRSGCLSQVRHRPRVCKGQSPPVGSQVAGVGSCPSGLRGHVERAVRRFRPAWGWVCYGIAESCPLPQLQEGFFLSCASPVPSRGTAEERCAGVLPGTCTPSMHLELTGGTGIRGPGDESTVGGGLGLLWSE